MKKLIVIGGATATGKTALAIRLAQHFDTEVLSADSRQFYREMNIGTAKPTTEELAAVPHHFVNSLSVQDTYAVGDYETDALGVLNELFQKKDVAVLVGGSGLFIRALCEGLDEFPSVPIEVVAALEEQLKTAGIASLQLELEQRDPSYFRQVDLQNPQRLIRALSVCRTSGLPYSSFRTGAQKARPFQPIYLLLELDRPKLYQRINQRVDAMMEQGLLPEAGQLLPFRYLNPLQTVGYQELFEFLDGKCNLTDAIESVKQNSRRYAKRQETWFRKHGDWNRLDAGSSNLLQVALKILQEAGLH